MKSLLGTLPSRFVLFIFLGSPMLEVVEKSREQMLKEKLADIEALDAKLSLCKGYDQKISVLENSGAHGFRGNIPPDKRYCLLLLAALGQISDSEGFEGAFADQLLSIEQAYKAIGGVLGYYRNALRLLLGEDLSPISKLEALTLEKVDALDLTKEFGGLFLIESLKQLPKLAEVYVVGGAGDRLDLRDGKSGEALPAAQLDFMGRSLLEGIFRDLQGREYAAFKLFGKQVSVPVALMTSSEKNNARRIRLLCVDNDWFERPQESIRFFHQPQSPVITIEGDWAFSELFQLHVKPGGHGMFWKMAEAAGVFDQLLKEGRRALIIRQVNNPVSGTDRAISALFGAGILQGKTLGFLTCDRRVNSPSGMIVRFRGKKDGLSVTGLTNIEYTELKKRGIEDLPRGNNDPYSLFPANVNLLYVDLQKILRVISESPFPGQIINPKGEFLCVTPEGKQKIIQGGRLETTMQNIADVLQSNEGEELKAFAVFEERSKALSPTKVREGSSKDGHDTPKSALYDMLQNGHRLLTQYCAMEVEPFPDFASFMGGEHPFFFVYHPALGPFYSVIGQKIQGGRIAKGSELKLEISELRIRDLDLKGRLVVIAENVTGHLDGQGIRRFSDRSGKCQLINVQVENLEIEIEGDGEFIAENVSFKGDLKVGVPPSMRIRALQDGGKVRLVEEKIDGPSWSWKYEVDRGEIILGLNLLGLSPR